MFAELAGFFFAVDAQDADEFIIFNERSSQGSEQVFFFDKFQIAKGLKLEVGYYHGLGSHASLDGGIDITGGQQLFFHIFIRQSVSAHNHEIFFCFIVHHDASSISFECFSRFESDGIQYVIKVQAGG